MFSGTAVNDVGLRANVGQLYPDPLQSSGSAVPDARMLEWEA